MGPRTFSVGSRFGNVLASGCHELNGRRQPRWFQSCPQADTRAQVTTTDPHRNRRNRDPQKFTALSGHTA